MAIDLETLEMMEMECEERMSTSLDVLKSNVLQIRAGRANPHILDKIQVEAYGAMSPINQIGNISVVDAQCLQRIKATNSTFVQAAKASSCNKFDCSALSTQNKHLAKQQKHITPTGQHPQKCRNRQFSAIPKC